MTNPRILNSRDIGITENALRAVLTKTLTSSNLDYNRWVALKVLAESTSPTLATDLAKQLRCPKNRRRNRGRSSRRS